MIDTTRKMFRFKLHHDKGTEIVVIPAIDEEAAVWMIRALEDCPPEANLTVNESPFFEFRNGVTYFNCEKQIIIISKSGKLKFKRRK